MVILVFSVYFGHFNMSRYFCHFLGSKVILIILEFSRLFWSFWSFRGYFGHFWGSKSILVIMAFSGLF
jgi:hypothetical protein